MKIEVDTKHDSREELAHVAELLQKLARYSRSGAVVTDSRQGNIFEDPAPSGGMFSMFGDGPSPSVPAGQSPAPAQSSEPASGGLFSIFGGDSSSSAPAEPSPQLEPYGGSPTVSELLAADSDDDSEISGNTSVKDILDDDNIVPY
ncbi:hypothetical protein KY359_05460 [Candidatus Woesearchaeota archaeon]|nr:hypothetical protein [Candidatus Woesearchaeota archaeon]